MDARTRHALEISLGLTVLGVQRWLSVREDIERELDRLGLGPAASVSRTVGSAVAEQLGRLAGGGRKG